MDNFVLALIKADSETFWQMWLSMDPKQPRREQPKYKVVSKK